MTGNCGLKTAATNDGMFHRCYQRPEYQELYGYGSTTRGTRDGIWWLSAGVCPRFCARYSTVTSRQLYDFVRSVVHPGSESRGEQQ